MRRLLISAEKNKHKILLKRILNLNFDHIPIEEQAVIMFPGQGTQYVGMGKKVIDHPPSRRLYEEANEILGYNLLDICLNGPKSKIDQTIYCQPSIFVSSMAAIEKLKAEQTNIIDKITDAAGFSIGEYCALVLGDVMSFADALKLIKIRAEAMHQCSMLLPSGMMTVKVRASSRLEQAIEKAKEHAQDLNEYAVCEIANYLFCGVKVIGGSNNCLDFLESNATCFDFRVLKKLPVSGAFHTKLMLEAEAKVEIALKNMEIRVPRINIYSNYTGKIYPRRYQDICKCIVRQISSPVKWEQIMQILFRKNKNDVFPSYYEVGPGKQLGTILFQISKKAYKTYLNYPC